VSDKIREAFEAWDGKYPNVGPVVRKRALKAAFEAGARWAFEAAAKRLEEMAGGGRNLSDYDRGILDGYERAAAEISEMRETT
jgi:hypothetical protein